MSTKTLGDRGENLASELLQKNGYKILNRNFRSKFGEIDIVAQDKETLVFVEVKARWSQKFGTPEEAITPWKIRNIIKAGQYYKLLNPNTPESLRIDAVVIDMFEGKLQRTEIIKNLTS